MQAVNHLAHNNHESCANFMSRWNVFATIECPLCGAKERTSHKFLLKVTVNSREVIDLVRELAQVCDDAAIVGILNRLGYRTGNENTWNEKCLQHVRHSNGIPACPPAEQRNWVTMSQAALHFKVSLMVVRRMIAQKILPARQVVKCAPWMIERVHPELPAVQKEIRRVHEGRRSPLIVLNNSQTRLFTDSSEV